LLVIYTDVSISLKSFHEDPTHSNVKGKDYPITVHEDPEGE